LEFHQFDALYLERLCAGDFRTQEHFVAYFSELIQLKLRSRLQSAQAIEDVRQETFVRVFSLLRGPSGMRQPERLGAFVNSTCNNVLLEHYRSTARHAPMEDGETLEIPDSAMDAVNIIAHKQMEKRVREILEELPERDRRVLKEIFIEERDKDDVCKDFGVDRDYLRVLLHRAKQNFRATYLQSMTASAASQKK
jgi:RNA polymerase sigma-70 factor, ECF subfamily